MANCEAALSVCGVAAAGMPDLTLCLQKFPDGLPEPARYCARGCFETHTGTILGCLAEKARANQCVDAPTCYPAPTAQKEACVNGCSATIDECRRRCADRSEDMAECGHCTQNCELARNDCLVACPAA